MLVRVDDGPAGLDRGGNDFRDVDRFDLEVDLALRDPRHVEKIVDETDKLLELTADDVLRPAQLFGADVFLLQHVHGIGDRCERIAQLVREHRQEFVLAPILLMDLSDTAMRCRARSRRGC